ncbi:unnamed protein product [Toxocara canis]|uniref:Uncharacterized protein n=1 Tax=Toxocara canis TaxID=6265 RepID=A0A183UB94_TOXCA|nr:unnamed protein product [Toxocara canis]
MGDRSVKQRNQQALEAWRSCMGYKGAVCRCQRLTIRSNAPSTALPHAAVYWARLGEEAAEQRAFIYVQLPPTYRPEASLAAP